MVFSHNSLQLGLCFNQLVVGVLALLTTRLQLLFELIQSTPLVLVDFVECKRLPAEPLAFFLQCDHLLVLLGFVALCVRLLLEALHVFLHVEHLLLERGQEVLLVLTDHLLHLVAGLLQRRLCEVE